jgi:hypothetical protein
VFWTWFLVSTPDIGHWFVNALVLAPILALAVAGLIHANARRFAVFGWSMVVGREPATGEAPGRNTERLPGA